MIKKGDFFTKYNKDQLIDILIDWYLSDTIQLLDNVLTDNLVDPGYSAITTRNRLIYYIQYKQQIDPDFRVRTVNEFLINSGYDNKDIIAFEKSCKEALLSWDSRNLRLILCDIMSYHLWFMIMFPAWI